MVYKIQIEGENLDAEFGQAIKRTEKFIGKYGDVLKKAEEYLKLIDKGFVIVSQESLTDFNKALYLANKDFDNVYRQEFLN